jgi:hypothetical protein
MIAPQSRHVAPHATGKRQVDAIPIAPKTKGNLG